MREWLIRHPMIVGTAFALLAFFSFRESISDAKTYHRFHEATPVPGEVMSIAKLSSVPPRWQATVKWRVRSVGAGESTITIGTKSKSWSTPRFSKGDEVEILIDPKDLSSAILRQELSDSRPMRLVGADFDSTDFWFGVFFAAASMFTFAFGNAIRRAWDDLGK